MSRLELVLKQCKICDEGTATDQIFPFPDERENLMKIAADLRFLDSRSQRFQRPATATAVLPTTATSAVVATTGCSCRFSRG